MNSKILITGASGGFGALTAKTLLGQGHTVVATMRNVDSKNKAISEELAGLGAHIVEMDVTSEDSVNSAVEESISLMNEFRLVHRSG